MPRKWEYAVVNLGGDYSDINSQSEEEILNSCGKEGWELVAVTIIGRPREMAEFRIDEITAAYLKREIG